MGLGSPGEWQSMAVATRTLPGGGVGSLASPDAHPWLQDLRICLLILPPATVDGRLLGPLSLRLASSLHLFHLYHLLGPSTSLLLTHRGGSQAREALPSSFLVRVHSPPDNPGWYPGWIPWGQQWEDLAFPAHPR